MRTFQDLKQLYKSRGAIRKEYYVNASYGIIHVEKPSEYLIRQQRQTQSGCAAGGAGVGSCRLEVEVAGMAEGKVVVARCRGER